MYIENYLTNDNTHRAHDNSAKPPPAIPVLPGAELSPRTFCTFRRELSSLRRTVSRRRTARNVFEELSGVSERIASACWGGPGQWHRVLPGRAGAHAVD
jgi:hypothetical protein